MLDAVEALSEGTAKLEKKPSQGDGKVMGFLENWSRVVSLSGLSWKEAFQDTVFTDFNSQVNLLAFGDWVLEGNEESVLGVQFHVESVREIFV